MIDKLIMQSTVNVTKVVQFLGSQWEFQPDDAWDNHVTFKYVAKGKPTLQKKEFNEMFPTAMIYSKLADKAGLLMYIPKINLDN